MEQNLNQTVLKKPKSVGFYFNFFLHGTFKRRTKLSHIAYNRLENLQIVTQRINILKDRKRNISNFAGVKKNKKLNKWTAQMKINKKFIHLGVFENEEDAGKIYEKAIENINNYLNPKQFRIFLK